MSSGAEYCPVHEYEWWDCCLCCRARKAELRRVDNYLRRYWWYVGLSFSERGRSRGFVADGTPYQKHRSPATPVVAGAAPQSAHGSNPHAPAA